MFSRVFESVSSSVFVFQVLNLRTTALCLLFRSLEPHFESTSKSRYFSNLQVSRVTSAISVMPITCLMKCLLEEY
ncbi:hypothetical protein AQUCO_02700437v1 [Aquilegia coerulea]|uniref:Uncharacterized protein n=1 Tax=Aquilegia coerulea TaxID=218851 RepID=A0A2G5D6W0_AQUCA|nr:hypothetical protein AQUCO_02700437v1 [Aquilegia coerulea]